MTCKIVTHWDGVLHILRNPYGFDEEIVRQARLDAADHIEALEYEKRDIERERDEAEMAIRMMVNRHRGGHEPIPATHWPGLERIATRNANPLRANSVHTDCHSENPK